MRKSTATRRSVCGISELEAQCDRSVTHVLSIMDPGWPTPAAFAIYPEHHRLDLRFHDAIEAAPERSFPSAAMSRRSSPSAHGSRSITPIVAMVMS